MIAGKGSILSRADPFAHVVAPGLLDGTVAEDLLRWLEADAHWRLRKASFYQQYECNLHEADLPAHVAPFVNTSFVDDLTSRMLRPITDDDLELVEVNAHKLVPGQTIRIHNDYIGDAETHRILLQLNRGWTDEQGGLLMLFSGDRAQDLARVVRPTHASATSFEISPSSFHAVSTIHSGVRYTLVYTFRRARFLAS